MSVSVKIFSHGRDQQLATLRLKVCFGRYGSLVGCADSLPVLWGTKKSDVCTKKRLNTTDKRNFRIALRASSPYGVARRRKVGRVPIFTMFFNTHVASPCSPCEI